jgi:predicted flap endonuclease-1-like 5' DNA nuclease
MSDGTENGTVMVKDIYSGNSASLPNSLIAVGNTLYFKANDGTNGVELWGMQNASIGTYAPTWSIHPSLPTGLSFDSSNGTITGTPTATQAATTYTIWANESVVSAMATVNITIDEFVPDPPSISPALTSVVLTNTTAMSPIEFTNSGGVIDTWEVYPSMPSGLTFDASNGTISGTPTIVQTAADYTVWANNTGGQSSATVNITIGELPPEFSYNESAINLTRLVSMDYLVPSVTGGPVDTWEIEPVLPEGLVFSYGEISGIPLVNMTETTFTVWANNSGGSDSNTFTIIIVEPPEGLLASQTFALLVRDVAMYNILVNYIGGDIDTWEIEPPLPLGLTFDTENNVISGTPVDVMAETNYTIWANSSTISDSLIITLKVLEDTDGDGDPDDLGGVTWPALNEDLDDDADGISDVAEGNANPITDSLLPDTDGDGVCDGSVNVTIRGVDICTGGPDHFPTDPAADTDTDGDGDPDEVRDGFDTNLTEDLDDDNDGLPDENETTDFSITDSLLPDTDGDGVCDGSINVTIRGEEICTGGPDAFPNDPAADTDTDGDGKPDELHGNSTTGLIEDLDDDGDQASDIYENESGTDPKDPLDFPTDDADGDGWTDAQEDFCGTDKFDNSSVPSDYDEDKWCDVDDPDDDNDGWFDDIEDACGTDSLDETSVPKDDDGNGICNSLEDPVAESDDGSIFPWWLCALFLLAIILILPIILKMKDDAEPENTTVDPECESGTGTGSNPFILEPVKELEPGERILSKETFTITNISPGLEIKIIDLNEEENGNRFSMSDKLGNQENPAVIVADNEGTITFRLAFDDADFLTYKGKECDALLKVGHNSVYMKWEVEIKVDSEQVKKNADKSAKKKSAKKKAVEEEAAAEDAEKKSAKSAEKKSAKSAKKKAVEEEVAAEDAEKKSAKSAKAAEKKAVEEEAAAEDAEKKSAKSAKKKAVEEEVAAEDAEKKSAKSAEKKSAKSAEKKSAKKKAVEEEAAAEDGEKKSAKSAEKIEEMERIRANAANIDFDIIGVASESDKDDLQTIKGIGQFIEEKLNILGIYTYLQISKMSSGLEGEVNEAIEFFPGRIKRDQWVNQAKTILGNDD